MAGQMNWVRLWHDMPTDPKWRVIARQAKQPISLVLSVYVHMLVTASTADERGRLTSWRDEDVAAALDVSQEEVEAVRLAMDGRVLDADILSGWAKRQPKREDSEVTRRVNEWREKKRQDETQCNALKRSETQCNEVKRNETQCNAPEERREEESREDSSSALPKRQTPTKGTRFVAEQSIPAEWLAFSEELGWDFNRAVRVYAKFGDYWRGQSGAKGVKLDWLATWRNWCRTEEERNPTRNQAELLDYRNQPWRPEDDPV